MQTITILEARCKTQAADSDFQLSFLTTDEALLILRAQFKLLDLRARCGIAVTRNDLVSVANFLRRVLNQPEAA